MKWGPLSCESPKGGPACSSQAEGEGKDGRASLLFRGNCRRKPGMTNTPEPLGQMETRLPLARRCKKQSESLGGVGQLRKSRSQMKLINFPYEQLFSFPSHATRYYKWKAKHK